MFQKKNDNLTYDFDFSIDLKTIPVKNKSYYNGKIEII